MPTFTYSAIDPTGARTAGEVSAADQMAALDMIAAKGLTPVAVNEQGNAEPWWNRDLALFGGPSLRPKEVESFFASLAAMLAAKTPLPRALAFCHDMTSDRLMKAKLADAVAAVKDGQSLADALSGGQVQLPERLITIIRLGETANSLEAVTARAAAMLKTEARLRGEVQQALVYPIILLTMSIFVMAVLVFYLAPTLAPVFNSADAPPPTIIAIMVWLQQTAVTHWPVMLAALFLGSLVVYLVRRWIAAGWQWAITRIPGFRQFRSKRETLMLLQTLYLILSSGGRLTDAIGTAATTARAPGWQAMLEQAKKDIEAGQSMTQALLEDPRIDPMGRSILKTGEEADQLVAVLEPAITTFEAQTSQMMSQLVKMLTPVLTLVIGLTVGAIILSTISAIMDLNDVVL